MKLAKGFTVLLLCMFLFSMVATVFRIEPVEATTFGAEELISYYYVNGADKTVNNVHPSSTTYKSAVSEGFNLSKPCNYGITKIGFKIRKYELGDPLDGNISARIYNMTGTLGTNALPIETEIIANSTNAFDLTAVTTSYAWYNFTFNKPILTKNVGYEVAWYVVNSTNIDNMHILDASYISGGGPTNQNMGYYNNSAWSYNQAARENLCYEVYGEPVLDITVTFQYNAGIFYVNSTAITNGTVTEYSNGTVLNLTAVASIYYVFGNFTWDAGNTQSNPYNLTVLNSWTVWCYFNETVLSTVYTSQSGSIIQQTDSGSSFQSSALGYPCQRESFYAKGYYWVFYHDGANNYYASSQNASVWYKEQIGGGGEIGSRSSVWYDGNETVHYPVAADDFVIYFYGTLNNSGRINFETWQYIEHTGGLDYSISSVTVDSLARVWVLCTVSQGASGNLTLWRSSTHNTTWITDSGFPYVVGNQSNQMYGTIIPLLNGQVQVVWGATGQLYSKLYNGTDWESQQTVMNPIQQNYGFSAVNVNNDTYVGYSQYGPVYGVSVKKFDYATRTWGSATSLTGGSYSTCPVLSVNPFDNSIYVFWASGNTLLERHYNGMVWSTAQTFMNTTSGVKAEDKINGFYYFAPHTGGIEYLQGTTAPYNITFAPFVYRNIQIKSSPSSVSFIFDSTNSTTNTTLTTIPIGYHNLTFPAPNATTIFYWEDCTTNYTRTVFVDSDDQTFIGYYTANVTLVTPPITFPEGGKYYFRSETQTTNSVTGYLLSSNQGISIAMAVQSVSGVATVEYVFTIDLVHGTTYGVNGTTTSLAGAMTGPITPVSEGYESTLFTIPATSLVIGQSALQVQSWVRFNGGSWILMAKWITEKLVEKSIEASVWNVTFYNKVTFTGGKTYAYIFWGSSSANSRIEGVSFVDPVSQEIALWKIGSGDWYGGILYPYMIYAESLFYGLAMLFIAGVLYLRHKKWEVILVTLFLFGGSAGIGFLIPSPAYKLIYMVIIVVIAFLLYKVFK